MTGHPLPAALSLFSRPTPVEAAPRLAQALGLSPDRLLLKRDDLMGLAGGGNKVRKLEVTLAQALAAGADTVVTTGAPQSNHARLTAAAAARCGLRCVLVLEGERPPRMRGNLLLDEPARRRGPVRRWARRRRRRRAGGRPTRRAPRAVRGHQPGERRGLSAGGRGACSPRYLTSASRWSPSGRAARWPGWSPRWGRRGCSGSRPAPSRTLGRPWSGSSPRWASRPWGCRSTTPTSVPGTTT
ncbi:hypothetical protein GCM10025868_32370 [Angustibacter aerolatus]|uniref:Tryptophan synthase beta chain-like PALP domain-containing protein n=1 Tax=Angustibacter aerolatus TaxID=1162965 RepID=A0ABQ6JID2_9ACTN|nr:pyridoxal-phosphate dependent enzyme [Angustibacter aerolatus]GMA87987.1 hypothetical protein GCM10025868_32370 [Angustibacter aerolatus]